MLCKADEEPEAPANTKALSHFGAALADFENRGFLLEPTHMCVNPYTRVHRLTAFFNDLRKI